MRDIMALDVGTLMASLRSTTRWTTFVVSHSHILTSYHLTLRSLSSQSSLAVFVRSMILGEYYLYAHPLRHFRCPKLAAATPPPFV